MAGLPVPSRRGFLGLAGGSLVGLTACGGPGTTPARPAADASAPAGADLTGPTPVAPARPTASGTHQAGVVTPSRPQPHLLALAYDVTAAPGPLLADLGTVVAALTTGSARLLGGIDPGDLTVTVGVGPRLVRTATPDGPGSQALPGFARERLTAPGAGADLLVQICASDPLVLPGSVAALGASVAGRAVERWRQRAFRGPYVDIDPGAAAPRNLLGFVDGIVGPRQTTEVEADVWLADGRAAGGTIMVVRRMEIELERFLAESVARQEAVIGRRRGSSAPLSGGDIATAPDLGAKTPTGAYLIPADAHVRRANPNATGVPPMLRRSYSFDDTGVGPGPAGGPAAGASGLFFVSFQRQLATFTATLNRMSVADALLRYTTTTRSGSYLVVPGFSPGRPLGSTLFAP